MPPMTVLVTTKRNTRSLVDGVRKGASPLQTEEAAKSSTGLAASLENALLNMRRSLNPEEEDNKDDGEFTDKNPVKSANGKNPLVQSAIYNEQSFLRDDDYAMDSLIGAIFDLSCENCFSAPSYQCSRCKTAGYCSSECQIAHWVDGGHHQECNLFH